ncbi:DUF3783 domain-containing protein [Romboutsia sp. 1001713B170207_170306_H8]|uniref:DUF3783 domain-containing protein n=1 Tax=Romboutsia sp. 1001713B170207_170306_H8 TaxID=2787112 RepID=UPI0008213FFA|nr:DUF3783 domain-containing protein [Romboutsia sp. 1001713B170207_170306_H8]SCI21653.1 Domain of uncharacterised function (DUF3783) [uncultured Clostridium sp.]
MTFTKINDVDNNTHNRDCIMIVNFNKKESTLIKNICGFIGVRDCIFLDKTNGNAIIKNILDNDISSDCEDGFVNKAVIFNNIHNKKINSFLESLKKMRINRPLTAMVTETSIDWTLNNLLYNLIEERKALSTGKDFSHK